MVFSWVSALANMEVYPKTSALQGPSVPIHEDVKLHRLFEQNAKSYPGHMAVVHEGEWFNENTYVQVYYSHVKSTYSSRLKSIRIRLIFNRIGANVGTCRRLGYPSNILLL